MGQAVDDESTPVAWPSDVGSVRYKYWGGRFVPYSELDSIWGEIADAIVEDAGAFDRRWGAGASFNYARGRHAADPTTDHWLFSWPEIEPDRLLYHYTSASTLAVIAEHGTLRMGPLTEMRDPREFGEWKASGFKVAGADVDVEDLVRAVAELRHNTKIVCFGRDLQRIDETENPLDRLMDPYRGRGFLRPRMWEQYADKHAGACIIFDRVALDRVFSERLAKEVEEQDGALPQPIPFHGEVRYDDSFDRRVHAGQLGVVDNEYSLFDWVSMDDWIREAFLTKDIDWSTEHEYRWGLMTSRPGPLFVELPLGCLVGVVLGLAWDPTNASLAETFANRFEITANVAQVVWDPTMHQLGCRLVDVGA